MPKIKPATAASFDAIEAEEARMDPSVLAAAVDQCHSFDLRDLGEEQLEIPELEVTRVPAGATVIDLRDRSAFDSWHHGAALWLEFPRALASTRTRRASRRSRSSPPTPPSPCRA